MQTLQSRTSRISTWFLPEADLDLADVRKGVRHLVKKMRKHFSVRLGLENATIRPSLIISRTGRDVAEIRSESSTCFVCRNLAFHQIWKYRTRACAECHIFEHFFGGEDELSEVQRKRKCFIIRIFDNLLTIFHFAKSTLLLAAIADEKEYADSRCWTSCRLQLVTQPLEILDDPVVDDSATGTSANLRRRQLRQ